MNINLDPLKTKLSLVPTGGVFLLGGTVYLKTNKSCKSEYAVYCVTLSRGDVRRVSLDSEVEYVVNAVLTRGVK